VIYFIVESKQGGGVMDLLLIIGVCIVFLVSIWTAGYNAKSTKS